MRDRRLNAIKNPKLSYHLERLPVYIQQIDTLAHHGTKGTKTN